MSQSFWNLWEFRSAPVSWRDIQGEKTAPCSLRPRFTTNSRPQLSKSLRDNPCRRLCEDGTPDRQICSVESPNTLDNHSGPSLLDLLSCCLVLYVTQNRGLSLVWEAGIADSEFSRRCHKLWRATFCRLHGQGDHGMRWAGPGLMLRAEGRTSRMSPDPRGTRDLLGGKPAALWVDGLDAEQCMWSKGH